jgi:hypothetical protein
MKTRKPRPRSPRSALLFISAAASSALKDPPSTSYADLTATLVRIERLALEALYPGEDVDPTRPNVIPSEPRQ